MPQTLPQSGDVLQVQIQIWRHEVSDTAELSALEDENAKLKRLLADTMLDNVVLKDLLGKS